MKFKIGDFVRCRATQTMGCVGEKYDQRRLVRHEKEVEGWIVGLVWRYEGELHPGAYEYDDSMFSRPTQNPSELRAKRAILLWKIARSLTNRPVEALEEDIDLIALAAPLKHVECPLRLGSPWPEGRNLRAEQREAMRGCQRDSRGRWLRTEPGGNK